MANHYKLEKVDPYNYIGKTWTLTHIAGTAFDNNIHNKSKSNLMLGKSSTIAKGNGGCNLFRASYQISEKERHIHF